MPIWLELLLELPACIQISQSNLWQDPTHSSFRTKLLAAAQQPKCSLLPNQHWPGKGFKNVKQKRVQSSSIQNLTTWPPCKWPKGHPHSSSLEEAVTKDILPGNGGLVENISSCPVMQLIKRRRNN